MEIDSSVICYGVGVTDPKAVLGIIANLEKRFGSGRIFDMPTSKNVMTEVAIGAALNGIKTVMTHQRIDFFLLAIGQIVNGAAKWHYMFGGQTLIPITIWLIIGRGWGQGPTHSQNLQAWFAHISGSKPVIPTPPQDAKGLLLASIFDPNPVIFLEQQGVSCEVIDLRSINSLDWVTIFNSVSKTGRLLALDSGFTTGSVNGEIVARVAMEKFQYQKVAPARLAMPDVPEPTSSSLKAGFYIRASDIAAKVMEIMGRQQSNTKHNLSETSPHDVPGEWFKGSF